MTTNTIDGESLHNIDTRLALVEADLRSMAGTRKIILGMAGFLVIQAIGAVVGFVEMRTEFRNLDLTEYESQVTTALRVLGDHGTELADIRSNDSELRSEITRLYIEISKQRDIIDDKTIARFYKADGDRLENRVERLESILLNAK